MQWQGKNPKTGQLWADTWCVADDLTPDLVDAYEARYKAGIPSTIVQVKKSPILRNPSGLSASRSSRALRDGTG